MKSGKFTVDQVENGIAIMLCRDDETERNELPITIFPFNVYERDIIEVSADGNRLKFEKLEDETQQAKQKADVLLEKLRKKNT